MDTQPNNPCTRCGKERIVVKTWKEYSGNSCLTHSLTACPDAKCQAIVNRRLAVQKEKKEALEYNRGQKRGFAKGAPVVKV